MLVWITYWFCLLLHVLSFYSSSNSSKTIQSMGFLDQISRLKAYQIWRPLLIMAQLSLVEQWHSESSTWSPDMVAIIYHGSVDYRYFLVQQDFFYTYQFMPKVSASKLKRQHITKVIAKHYYNALFCGNFGLIVISLSLADSSLNNQRISSR